MEATEVTGPICSVRLRTMAMVVLQRRMATNPRIV
jgi:hypothetical protein